VHYLKVQRLLNIQFSSNKLQRIYRPWPVGEIYTTGGKMKYGMITHEIIESQGKAMDNEEGSRVAPR
jgi:hypothetical protein